MKQVARRAFLNSGSLKDFTCWTFNFTHHVRILSMHFRVIIGAMSFKHGFLSPLHHLFNSLHSFNKPQPPRFLLLQASVGVLEPRAAPQLHRGREHTHHHKWGDAHHRAAGQQQRPASPGAPGSLPKAPQLHEQNPPAHAPRPTRGIWLVHLL